MAAEDQIVEEAREWSHHQEIGFSTVLYRSDRNIDFSLFQHLLPPHPITILDLGCNGSYVAHKLREMGHDAYGADLPAVVRRAQMDYPEDAEWLLSCNLDTGDIPGGPYDLVLTLGVIEHLVRHDLFFGKVLRRLKPGGLAFVSTCNREAIEIERHHYHHFLSSELRGLALTAGLEEVAIGYPTRTSLTATFRRPGGQKQGISEGPEKVGDCCPECGQFIPYMFGIQHGMRGHVGGTFGGRVYAIIESCVNEDELEKVE